ncbi:MAG: hypothetical protein PUP91_18035 [Rhizonema sp. PD37]|nr:hypothetical protein [Rhizonema sp. PD37]
MVDLTFNAIALASTRASALQRRGAEVTVIAKKGMLSQQLSEIADDVIFLDDLQYKIAKYTKLSIA